MDAFDPTFQSMRTFLALEAGASRKELRGPHWILPRHGIARSADLALTPLQLRVSDAAGLLTPGCALGGWTSLWVQGNAMFDGIDVVGNDRDVLIHCLQGSQLRRRPGIRPSEGALFSDELLSFENYDVSTMARAVYDEMRTAANLRAAVVALDMAISTTTGMPHTTLTAVCKVVDSHHKTRGITQARKALGLASTRSASPWEVRTRLIAELDADLMGLLVNAPVFGLDGSLLGIADLLDPATGLVIESDGAGHREVAAHSADNIREEKFERALMVVVRVTAFEHRDRYGMARRMRDAQRDAKAMPDDRWTLEKPDWWWTWPPALVRFLRLVGFLGSERPCEVVSSL